MKALTITEAKRSLGRAADEALNGGTVFILRRSRLLALQEYHPPEPVPLRPAGWFRDLDSREEAALSNRLAARGPRGSAT